jgi:hypothetical protein
VSRVVSLPRPQTDVDRSAREVTKRSEELAAAKRAEADAIAAYDATGDDAGALEGASRARLRRERHERLLDQAEAALAAAKAAETAAKKAALAAMTDGEIVELEAWTSKLDTAALLALDRELEKAVLVLVAQVADASDLFDRILDHSAALGRHYQGERPSVAAAKLILQRAVARARDADRREDLAEWLVSASTDWKDHDLPAEALAANALAAERAAADATREAFEAGRRAAQPPPPAPRLEPGVSPAEAASE